MFASFYTIIYLSCPQVTYTYPISELLSQADGQNVQWTQSLVSVDGICSCQCHGRFTNFVFGRLVKLPLLQTERTLELNITPSFSNSLTLCYLVQSKRKFDSKFIYRLVLLLVRSATDQFLMWDVSEGIMVVALIGQDWIFVLMNTTTIRSNVSRF